MIKQIFEECVDHDDYEKTKFRIVALTIGFIGASMMIMGMLIAII